MIKDLDLGAILIGVSEYDKKEKMPNLDIIVNDIEEITSGIRSLLKGSGDNKNIHELKEKDADFLSIRKKIYEVFLDVSANNDYDVILIYFSGYVKKHSLKVF